MDPASVQKLQEIDHHIGCASAGIASDAKMLIDHARVECQNHTFSYNEPLNVQTVTQSVADLYFDEGKGKKKMSRPFGTSLLIAGVDENGP